MKFIFKILKKEEEEEEEPPGWLNQSLGAYTSMKVYIFFLFIFLNTGIQIRVGFAG